jgi:hypothetical protein
MATDTNFVATGPGDVGVEVKGTVKVGVEATGTSAGGSFHLLASTRGASAVIADNPLCNAWRGAVGLAPATHQLFGIGVYGHSDRGHGVHAESDSNAPVFAQCNSGDAIFAGVGVVGVATSGGLAGSFDGDVEVIGNINCDQRSTITCFDVSLIGGDCDKRVVGVVSGAGDCKPGIVLDRRGSAKNRKPIALLGKVFCKVDAQYGAIDLGDLLTTSPTSGHAMRAGNPSRAFGAVIGKALHPFTSGQGLIPILIALQ